MQCNRKACQLKCLFCSSRTCYYKIWYIKLIIIYKNKGTCLYACVRLSVHSSICLSIHPFVCQSITLEPSKLSPLMVLAFKRWRSLKFWFFIRLHLFLLVDYYMKCRQCWKICPWHQYNRSLVVLFMPTGLTRSYKDVSHVSGKIPITFGAQILLKWTYEKLKLTSQVIHKSHWSNAPTEKLQI